MDSPYSNIYNENVNNLYLVEIPSIITLLREVRRYHRETDIDSIVMLYSIFTFMEEMMGSETFDSMLDSSPLSSVKEHEEAEYEDPFWRRYGSKYDEITCYRLGYLVDKLATTLNFTSSTIILMYIVTKYLIETRIDPIHAYTNENIATLNRMIKEYYLVNSYKRVAEDMLDRHLDEFIDGMDDFVRFKKAEGILITPPHEFTVDILASALKLYHNDGKDYTLYGGFSGFGEVWKTIFEYYLIAERGG